jgi:V8-like Glu-specific endopeptidase
MNRIKYSADASWVPYANVDARIYDYDVNTKNVTSYADPSLGQYVYKSGVVTGKTYGKVTKKMTIYNLGVGKNLDNQYIAQYRCNFGDSGSPVYVYVNECVKIVGIQWGGFGTYNSDFSNSVFSPVSGVKSDLGVTPLTA